MVLCHPRWLPTSGLTEFAVCWGGAGFEPRTTDLQSGVLPLCHQVGYHWAKGVLTLSQTGVLPLSHWASLTSIMPSVYRGPISPLAVLQLPPSQWPFSGCQRLPFLSWRAVAWSKTWIGTDYWWDLLCEGGVALACPWEWWPWCRPFPGADATIPNRIATCYYKIAPTKQLWDHQNGYQILSRHRQCPKCPRELVWAS